MRVRLTRALARLARGVADALVSWAAKQFPEEGGEEPSPPPPATLSAEGRKMVEEGEAPRFQPSGNPGSQSPPPLRGSARARAMRPAPRAGKS